jgi:hypothetical protein
MTVDKFNPRWWWILLMMVAIAAIRIPNAAWLTPMARFTPVGAIALFGGTYFSKRWKAIILSLLTLLASDLIINRFVFHLTYGVMYSGWCWVYIVFIWITLLGGWIVNRVTVKNVLLAAFAATASHWLLLDFMVWAGGGIDLLTMLPLSRDFNGLIQCYIQGFPFAKYFLGGTLIYSVVMFGAYEWINYTIYTTHSTFAPFINQSRKNISQ